jgi:hypothetical protein
LGALLADVRRDAGQGVIDMTPVEWIVYMLGGGVSFGLLAALVQGRG